MDTKLDCEVDVEGAIDMMDREEEAWAALLAPYYTACGTRLGARGNRPVLLLQYCMK